MTLTELRASQHEDLVLPSDHALIAFLLETSVEQARLDRVAHMTEVELRHLGRSRR